jgi:predicted RNase H-like nuclease (RuvC/YqgF family)
MALGSKREAEQLEKARAETIQNVQGMVGKYNQVESLERRIEVLEAEKRKLEEECLNLYRKLDKEF